MCKCVNVQVGECANWEMCKCTLTNIEDVEAVENLIRIHGFFEYVDEPDNLCEFLKEIKNENFK